MIKILDLYISRTIVAGATMTLLVLAGLDIFIALLQELEDVGKGSYSYQNAFSYILLTMPRRVYELFPIAVLVGSLLSLGALAGNSELIAMRAAGVSVGRIVWSVAQAGFVLMLLLVLLGEFVVPPAERYANNLRAQKLGQPVSQLSENGLWVRDGRYFINIKRVFSDLQLQGILIYEFNEQQQLSNITQAQLAVQEEGHWQLRDIVRTSFKETAIQTEAKAQEHWPTLLDKELFSIIDIEPGTMSAYELNNYIEYLLHNKLEASVYQLAFWLKVTKPLSCVVLLLVVLPFVFGSLRSAGSGQLLTIGILLGVVFMIISQIASQLGQIYAVPPFISAILPVVCFSFMGLYGLRKVQ